MVKAHLVIAGSNFIFSHINDNYGDISYSNINPNPNENRGQGLLFVCFIDIKKATA